MEQLYNVRNIKERMAQQLAKQIITEMVEPDVPELPNKTRTEERAVPTH